MASGWGSGGEGDDGAGKKPELGRLAPAVLSRNAGGASRCWVLVRGVLDSPADPNGDDWSNGRGKHETPQKTVASSLAVLAQQY